jgi:hypothetical protein
MIFGQRVHIHLGAKVDFRIVLLYFSSTHSSMKEKFTHEV